MAINVFQPIINKGIVIRRTRISPSGATVDEYGMHSTFTVAHVYTTGIFQELTEEDTRFYPQGVATLGDYSFFLKSGVNVRNGDYLYPSGLNQKFEVKTIIKERDETSFVFQDIVARLLKATGVS